MSGSGSKQEYTGNSGSSSRTGGRAIDWAQGGSGRGRGSSGSGGGGGGGWRGRGKSWGGGEGRDSHHYHQHQHRQWVPPSTGSEWRGDRGGGGGRGGGGRGGRGRSRSHHYNQHDDSGGSGRGYNSNGGGGGGGGSSGSRVVPGSSISNGSAGEPAPNSRIRWSEDGTTTTRYHGTSHSNDYTARYHPGDYARPQAPPPPPPPTPPPPTPKPTPPSPVPPAAAAAATTPATGGGRSSRSSSRSSSKRPPPVSPASLQKAPHEDDAGAKRRRRRSDGHGARGAGGDGGDADGGAGSGGGRAGGNGDEAGGESGDASGGGAVGGGRARGSKGRKSRQSGGDESGREGDAPGSASTSSVSDRRKAKLKELKVLCSRRKEVSAAGKALAEEVEKNRMEQDEIAIQIDAAKRLLALYDSSSSTAEVSIVPSPTTHPLAASSTPPPSPLPAEVTTPPPVTPVSRSSGTVRGRGGGGVRASGPSRSSVAAAAASSSSSPSAVSAATPSVIGSGKGSSARSGGGNKGTNVSSSSSSSSDSGGSDDDERYPLGGKRKSLPGGGVGGEGFGLITSMPPAGGSGGGGGSVVSSASASRTSRKEAAAAAAARKPSSNGDASDEFPSRVGVDGSGAGGGVAAEPGRSRSDGSRGTTGIHTGVEVNGGSFNIVKQLMFKTSRSHKPRAMAFNPAVPGLFAVCSADLSLDLWRYGRNNQELEKVSERNDVTPIGAAHMAWNPSGTHLAIGHSGSTLVDNWAATIVAKDGKKHGDMKLRSDRHNKPAQAVAWVTPSTNNQDHLVTGGEDGHVVIWTRVLDAKSDLHKVAILHSKHTSAVRSACCPSISPTVITGGTDGRLVSYSIETASVQWEELLRVRKTYHPMVNELLEFPDNPHSLLVSTVDTARSHSFFTMDTRQPPSMIHAARRMEWKRKDEKKPFSGLVYPSISPCGRYVACAGDWNGSFHIWDVRSQRSQPMQSVLVNSVARVAHTAWHPDPGARALMSLSAASGQSGKNFALHLHAGLRP